MGPLCSKRSWSTAILEGDHQISEQLNERGRKLYRGSSKITLANSKDVSEKVINLASANTYRGWMWKGRGRLIRSTSRTRKVDCCGAMPSSTSGEWGGFTNFSSPTLDPSIVDELKQWPPCRPLDDVPPRYEVEEAIRALANRKAVGSDGLPAELLNVLADEGELNTLGKRYHRRCVEGRWRAATMERCND